jgi:MFS family permease
MMWSRRTTVFVLFTAAYFMSYFFRSANAVIAPDLARELQLDAGQLGLMTSLFFATFAAVQVPLGIALDRWGPRWVTSGLMWVGVAGSLIFAAASAFPLLALGRALIGVGMAGILMGSLKIFSQWYSSARFATASGLLVGIGSSGALAAATPLAWLNNQIGWRAVFVVGGVATGFIALAIMLWTRNSPPGVEWSGNSPQQGRMGEVFGDGRFWRIVPLLFFLAGTTLGVQGLWAGPYLYDVLRLDEIQTGNILFVLSLGATIGYALSGWSADRFGMAKVLVLTALIFALSQVALVLQPPLLAVQILFFVFGITGAYNVMMMAQIRQIFPLHMTGKAVSAANMFAIGGAFLLQWWMGLIVGLFPVGPAGHYPPAAYGAALLFTALGTFITWLWYLPAARRIQGK